MLRRLVLAGALLAPIFLSACDDKDTTAPTGTPGTVAVRAYVDSDGSGSFTEGDVAISGSAVTLTTAAGTSVQGTTGAGGVATFENVTPGSYTASFGGNAPAGAVLASATGPVIVVPYAGGAINGEFRFVFNPGSISGVLYRDNNDNGVFDPTIDTPAPGTDVHLFPEGDTSGDPIGTTTTDSDGVFSFPVVRGGTYTLQFEPFPTITLVGGNEQTVVVNPASETDASVQFTGSLIGTIAEARANDPEANALVAVEGIVTAVRGTFNASSIYIQDATAGILVFGIDSDVQPQLGDRVRVVGRIDEFRLELEIVDPIVTILESGSVPTPRVVTGAQINAFDFQGELVTTNRVQLVSMSSGSSFNAVVVDGAGTEFVVRSNSITGLTREMFTVGNYYDITGVLNRFNATAQLAPRFPADVVPAAASLPIGEARLRQPGDTVLIEGVVTAGVGVFSTSTSGNQFNVQDATGGILILDTPLATGPQQGDSVTVRGVLRLSAGELLIRDPQITVLGTGTVPDPIFITGAYADASTDADPLQGSLVRVNNLLVTAVSGTATSTSYNVTVQEPTGGTFTVRVGSAATGIPQTFFQVGSTYDVTGTLASFNGAQIKVRSQADVVASGAAPMTIEAARAAASGDTVTIEGVVTAPVGVFSSSTSGNQFNVQDGTGGVLILDTPISSGIKEGDFVRVRAVKQASAGEVVLRGPTITILGTGAVPAPVTITGAQVAASTEADSLQGMLVHVDDVLVTAVSGSATSSSFNVTVQTDDGATFIVRVGAAGAGISQTFFQVGSRYDVTGTLGNFNGAQVKLRKPSDAVAS